MKLKVQETALLGGSGLKKNVFILAVFFYHTAFLDRSLLPYFYPLSAPGASQHMGKTKSFVQVTPKYFLTVSCCDAIGIT